MLLMAWFVPPWQSDRIMTKTKLTPNKVKVIETALEERKSRNDRRKDKADEYAGPERRSAASAALTTDIEYLSQRPPSGGFCVMSGRQALLDHWRSATR